MQQKVSISKLNNELQTAKKQLSSGGKESVLDQIKGEPLFQKKLTQLEGIVLTRDILENLENSFKKQLEDQNQAQKRTSESKDSKLGELVGQNKDLERQISDLKAQIDQLQEVKLTEAK